MKKFSLLKRNDTSLALLFIVMFVSTMLARGYAEARFFQKHSTWYEKINESHSIHPKSPAYINDILINGSTLTVNHKTWSTTVWNAKPDTPFTKVFVRDSRAALYGWDSAPIPAEAVPPGGTDGHMSVISADKRYVWDFYNPKKTSSGWEASIARRWDLTTDGVNQPYDNKGSPRACPHPHLHGLITYEEIQRGYIDHALQFSYRGDKAPLHWGVYPCAINRTGVSDRPGAMNLGERIQLDPSINVDSLSLNRAGKIIARAMQEYGMIFVIVCAQGCNTVYAESLVNKSISWDGILGSLGAIPINRLRVLDPIYPSAGGATGSGSTIKPLSPQNLVVGQ